MKAGVDNRVVAAKHETDIVRRQAKIDAIKQDAAGIADKTTRDGVLQQDIDHMSEADLDQVARGVNAARSRPDSINRPQLSTLPASGNKVPAKSAAAPVAETGYEDEASAPVPTPRSQLDGLPHAGNAGMEAYVGPSNGPRAFAGRSVGYQPNISDVKRLGLQPRTLTAPLGVTTGIDHSQEGYVGPTTPTQYGQTFSNKYGSGTVTRAGAAPDPSNAQASLSIPPRMASTYADGSEAPSASTKPATQLGAIPKEGSKAQDNLDAYEPVTALSPPNSTSVAAQAASASPSTTEAPGLTPSQQGIVDTAKDAFMSGSQLSRLGSAAGFVSGAGEAAGTALSGTPVGAAARSVAPYVAPAAQGAAEGAVNAVPGMGAVGAAAKGAANWVQDPYIPGVTKPRSSATPPTPPATDVGPKPINEDDEESRLQSMNSNVGQSTLSPFEQHYANDDAYPQYA
jgi:hypothetical protein